MASPPIKQLNGHNGYLRWKELMLLRVHALGVERVLFEDPPAAAGAENEAAAKKWARDDAVCRGHIFTALSDRLLPDYARFATAAELWRALARTYDVVTSGVSAVRRFNEFRFDEGGPLLLLEQIAHAQALGAAAGFDDHFVAFVLCGKLPEVVRTGVITRSKGGMTMDIIWDVARRVAGIDIDPEHFWRTTPI